MGRIAIILLEEIQCAIARSLARLKSAEFPTGKCEPSVLGDEAALMAAIDMLDSQAAGMAPTLMQQAQGMAQSCLQEDAIHSSSCTPSPAQIPGAEQ